MPSAELRSMNPGIQCYNYVRTIDRYRPKKVLFLTFTNKISYNNKSNKDASQHSRRKFIFGIFVLLLVDILWVISSELTKYIYTEKKLERPFLVTYISSSILFVYLIILCFTPPTRDPCRPVDYTQLVEPTAETDDENCFNDSGNSLVSISPEGCEKLGDSMFVPVRAGETTDSDDAAPRAVRFNKVAEVRVMSATQAGEALLARLSWSASLRASEHAQRKAAAAATRRHLRIALCLCVPWFLSNYFYRLSLVNSASSSATIYASTAAAFVMALSAIFVRSNDRFTLSKFSALLLISAGLVMLAVAERQQSKWPAVLSALGSAICYTVHLFMFRHEIKKGDGINSPLLVGLVGCGCGCLMWAMGGVLAATGVEGAELPQAPLWSWLLIDAALSPLFMETLWLWGVSLTSCQTATAMLALTMPVSICAESMLGGTMGWRGVASILAAAGWLLAVLDLPSAPVPSPLTWLRDKLRTDGFSSIRNVSELDEQTEALMSSDEPT